MPFDNPPKSPYLNLPSKSPVPLPPSTPFSTDHFVSCTCSENTRKSVRTASTPHTDFRLDPSFTSLPSQGRSALPPVQGQPRALPPTPSDLLTDFAGSGGLSAPFLRLPFFPLLRGTKTRVSLQPQEQHPVTPPPSLAFPSPTPFPSKSGFPRERPRPAVSPSFPPTYPFAFSGVAPAAPLRSPKPQRLPESRDALLSPPCLTPWGCFLKSHFLLEKSLPHWLVSTLSSISS